MIRLLFVFVFSVYQHAVDHLGRLVSGVEWDVKPFLPTYNLSEREGGQRDKVAQ